MFLRPFPPAFGLPGSALNVNFVASTTRSRKCSLGDELADQLFALAAGVPVGGVDEVAALLDVTVEQAARDALLGAPSPFGAERHRAEAERADAQSGSSKRFVFVQLHSVFLRSQLSYAAFTSRTRLRM